MWSYIHRRYVGDTKICGVIYIEDMWGTQKYVELYTLKLCGGNKNIWCYIHRRYVGDTKICGVLYIEDMWGTQKYVELYT